MSWFRNSRYATEGTVVIGNRTYLFFFSPQQQEAALLGKKVMVLDYVVPTPKGTSWGTVSPLTLTLLYLLNVFFPAGSWSLPYGDQVLVELVSMLAAFQRS